MLRAVFEFLKRTAKKSGRIVAVYLICGAASALWGQPVLKYPVTLGVDERSTQEMYAALVRQTIKSLQEILGESGLVVRTLSQEDLREAVYNNKVDFFLSSSAFYRQMARAGARDLATVQTVRAIDPNFSQGALVLVKDDRTELRTFKDLIYKRLARLSDSDSTLQDMVETELLSIQAVDGPAGKYSMYDSPESLFAALEENNVDAVVLPSCFLEWYADSHDLDTSWMRVVSPRQNAALMCAYSTRLYPNLTMASLPKMPSVLARTLTNALLNIKRTSDNEYFWGIATNFKSIDQMLRMLDKDAWYPDRKWTFEKFIREYYPLVLAVALIILSLCLHSAVVGRLVRKRTFELTCALREQKRLQVEVGKANVRIEKMQKIGVLGHLSALFAHELGQPLNNIAMYAFSLRRQINKGAADREKICRTLKEIEGQSERAGNIIRGIRKAVRSQAETNRTVELSGVVRKAIDNFKLAQQFSGDVELSTVDGLFVKADPLEIELIILNLLRNSAQAQETQAKRAIFLKIQKVQDEAVLSVCDRGPAMSEESISKLTVDWPSSKPEGLGLGLSIVRNLIEVLGGHIKFCKSSYGGLQVNLTIPLSKESQ